MQSMFGGREQVFCLNTSAAIKASNISFYDTRLRLAVQRQTMVDLEFLCFKKI